MKGAEDEDLFTPGDSVWVFIVSLNAPCCVLKQPAHVKASKMAFLSFFLFPALLTSPLALDGCVGLTGCRCSAEWPFPVLHPLKCKQLPRYSPPPHYGIECVWPFWKKTINNNGWRPFIWLAFSGPTRRTFFLLCGLRKVPKHNNKALAMWLLSVEITIIWQTTSGSLVACMFLGIDSI